MVAASRPNRRLGLALAFSLFAHALIAARWDDFQGDRVLPVWRVEARLEAPLAAPAVPEPDQPVTPEVLAGARNVSSTPVQTAAGRVESSVAEPLPGAGGDRHFYSARELDQYPEPLDPGKLMATPAADGVRVWVSIDREGIVQQVVAVDAGHAVDAARERLLAMRFVPARRAGLPVNSRVLMELPGR